MSEFIRVEAETYAALEDLKGENERFDELLSRLVDERRAAFDDGAGLWAGSDAAERARDAREEMK